MAEGLKKAIVKKSESSLRVLEAAPSPPSIGDMADEDLMLAHAAGSEKAFEELVRRRQKGILNYVYRMVQNRQIAEEITQEVFLALVKNAHRYEPRAKFTTYLYAIASNMISKEWLRRKRRPKVFSLFGAWNQSDDDNYSPLDRMRDEKADVVAAFRRGEVSDAVSEALRFLPEHQREAFILRRFQDLSYNEISKITKVPIGTAKSRVVRAERALRPLLEAYREYV